MGSRRAQVEELLRFVKVFECEYLYIVGDFIDGWCFRRRWYWEQSHNDLIQKLLRKARKGTKVVFVPGNHDEFVRPFIGFLFGGIEIKGKAIHSTADGRRLLVLHGHEFDGVIACAKWLHRFGSVLYDLLLEVNLVVGYFRRKLGYPPWSLSAWLKQKSKQSIQYIANFEELVTERAREEGVDGVVCGHIHAATMREINGVLYCNDGDWVESCTALVEHWDGRLEVLRFS